MSSAVQNRCLLQRHVNVFVYIELSGGIHIMFRICSDVSHLFYLVCVFCFLLSFSVYEIKV